MISTEKETRKSFNSIRNIMQIYQRGNMGRGFFALFLLLSAFVGGIAISMFNIVYGIAIAGMLIMTIIVLLRCNALTIALLVATHLWVDWFLALHLVAILMMVFLLFAYYFGRSAEQPWIGLRPLWLWALFLLLNIYPAINGAPFLLWDAATYYPSIVLGACLMFWLGSLVARDISSLRRVLQLLAFITVLIALHTIIESATGIFLFSTAHEDTHLATSSNLYIVGTVATRSASFFIDPNWNGCFLAMMFFIPLGLFMESKSALSKCFYLGEMGAILVALLFTYSNGSWVGWLGGAVAFAFWVGSWKYRWSWCTLLVLSTLLILTIFHSQLGNLLVHASTPGELSMRQGAWETGIRVINAYPLFGVGLGSQAYLIRANPYVTLAQIIPLPHPHNAYIQWGAMAGIPVMLIFFMLLGYALWHSWRTWQAVDLHYRPLLGGAITAIIVLSINSMSVDGWTHAVLAPLAWLILGMLTSPLLLRYIHTSQQQTETMKHAGENKL